MSKDAVLSEILSMPVKDQRAIWKSLDSRFGGEVYLSAEQELELKRRMDRIDKDGFQGEPWEVVEKDLRKVIKNARRSNRTAR